MAQTVTMKFIFVLCLLLFCCGLSFGASPNSRQGTYESVPVADAGQEGQFDALAWPGAGNKQARKTSRKARRHTMRHTRGGASKTRNSVKRKGSKYKQASRKGFDKAAPKKAPKKKAGCKG